MTLPVRLLRRRHPFSILNSSVTGELQMGLFRTLLVMIVIVVSGYTVVVVNAHGLNLFPTFFGDMAKTG